MKMSFSRSFFVVAFCVLACVFLLSKLTVAATSNVQPPSEFSIQEDQPPGSVVGGIKESQHLATEFGEDVLSRLRFSFRYTTMNYRYFVIDQNTGIIRTSRKIDREVICPGAQVCNLSLDVVIRPVEYFQIIKVVVTVTDVNDNSPSFLQSRLSLEMKENTSPGTLFSLPLAEDPDSGVFGVQDYQLISTSEKFKLILKRQYDGSSDVRLNLTESLDREVRDFYSMVIVAVDGGNPPRSGSIALDVIVGDANDNNPRFDQSSYEIEVSESLVIGSTFLRVHAIDLDDGPNGMIVYGFADYTENLHGQLFGINNQTGEIYLKKALDYERETTLQLTVVASDLGLGSLPAYAKVTVIVLDENDNSPQITLNSLTSSGLVEVTENSEPGAFAAYIAVRDLDSSSNGDVECTLDTELFQLESVYESEFKLKTSVRFDREQKSEYLVTLTCYDKGNPVRASTLIIKVNILDENDNAPSLKKNTYVVEIAEANAVGILVFNFSATDEDASQNGMLRYELDHTADNTLLIDSATGIVVAKVAFDYETVREYTHRLTVSDSDEVPLSTSATLILKILDVNDEVPSFERPVYHFSVTENLPLGSAIGAVSAIDADITPAFNKVTYSIPYGSSAVEIDSSSGSLKTIRRIDREEVALLEFSVMAANEGYPAMKNFVNVSVYIEDENDNPPLIQFPNKQNQVIQLSSQTAIGSFVCRISASDPDLGSNAQLVYTIANGNELETFAIDGKTGAVSTTKSLPKGAEMTYWLVITVRDCGNPELMSAADLIIQVNSSSGDASNLSPHSGESFSSQVFFGEKLMILTGMVCSVVLILILVFAIVFFIWRHKQNKRRWQMEMESRMTPLSDPSLKRPLSSITYYGGSHLSQRSLGSQSVTVRCKDFPNDTTSGTERDDSEDDSSHVTSLCLKKEHHPDEEATSNMNLRTLDVLPPVRPVSCNSQQHRNRRRKPVHARSKAVHSRSGSRPNTRQHQSCKSDNELSTVYRPHGRGCGRAGGSAGTGSGSECSGSYFDSGMDPSEDSDNRHCVSRSS